MRWLEGLYDKRSKRSNPVRGGRSNHLPRDGSAKCGVRILLVMVGGAVAHPAATPERSVKLSLHSAPQYEGCCHQHRLRSLVDALLEPEDVALNLLPR
jgi:hypothetical protein